MHRNRVSSILAVLIVLGSTLFFPVTTVAGNRSDAESAFLHNRPEEAAPLYERALEEEPHDAKLYRQLAVVYEQLGDYERAEEILRLGMERAGGAHEFLHNLGNSARRQGNNDAAFEYFGRAISENREFPLAYRNRANIRVERGEYERAIEDYEEYLGLRSDSPERAEVESMISALNARLETAEREREERDRAEREAQERREALRESVRQRLEEERRRTDRSRGGDEGFQGIDDDLDILE